MDILEFSAIEEWKRGKSENLVRFWEQQKGKVPSAEMHRFLLWLLQGKKGKKGAPKKTGRDWNINQDYLFASLLVEKLRKSRKVSNRREIIASELRALLAISEQDPLPLSKTAIKEALAKRYNLTTATRIDQILSPKK